MGKREIKRLFQTLYEGFFHFSSIFYKENSIFYLIFLE